MTPLDTHDELPQVGGRTVSRAIADLENAALVLIRDEQEKINCDNALIAVLCDTVRLIREHLDYVKAPPVPREERGGLVLEMAKKALERIARWHGEFPPTGREWDDGSPMSYGACYGSNGERDYMRGIAAEALEALAAAPQEGWVMVPSVLLINVRDVLMNVQNDIRSPGDDALMPRLVNQIDAVLHSAARPRPPGESG